MGIIIILIIAVSLSMDAFSLSLIYGTLGINKNAKYFLSCLVGIFHFFMPIFGMFFSNIILNFIKVDFDIIIFCLFSFIGVSMFLSSFKEKEDIKSMKKIEFFLFAFAVSIDSFSIGITLKNITPNYIVSPIIFALFSSFFTFVGLFIGNKIKKSVGKISTMIGGIILTLIGIIYLF